METIDKQPCPMCNANAMTLTEDEKEVPYFGKVYVFSMSCHNCKYHKADVEVADSHESSKWTVEVNDVEDLKIRIVKSSAATLKIPHVVTVEPGAAASGYVTNVEGIIRRVKHQVESARDSAEDKSDRKKAKNLLKKLTKVMNGEEKLKIIIEDPTGNSAIISEKAKKTKF